MQKSMDFAALREVALRRVQELAGRTWTDHNLHDPGITILEALAYAITDLGYRTSFGVADLLAEPPGTTQPTPGTLYTAPSVMPSCPVTERDFRKLVIDCLGVKNAWLRTLNLPTTALQSDLVPREPQIYYRERGAADQPFQKLAYGKLDAEPEIMLKGIYDVLVELDKAPDGTDLNVNAIATQATLNLADGPLPLNLDIVSPNWNAADLPWLADYLAGTATVADFTLAVANSVPILQDSKLLDGNFYYTVTLTYLAVPYTIPLFVRASQGFSIGVNYEAAQAEIRIFLENPASGNALEQLIQRHVARNLEVENVLAAVTTKLHQHRSLCEDFRDVKPACVVEIAVHAELMLRSDANPMEVLAHVFHQFANHISPSVKFHAVSELRSLGYRTEDIFNGPLLEHGVILDDELDGLNGGETVYTSDLIRIAMRAIPNGSVMAIKHLTISDFKDNVVRRAAEMNCIHLTDFATCKPRLSLEKSRLTLTKDGVEIPVNMVALRQRLAELEAGEQRYHPTAEDATYLLPTGRYRDVGNYQSLQELLPATYAIGSHVTGPDAPVRRQAQTAQLQGFLMVFDQILASAFSQINNVKKLLSLEQAVATYATQPLYGITGASRLIRAFSEGNQDWETFMADAGNAYYQGLLQAAETPTLGADRRGRFLSHLLGRFGEAYERYPVFEFLYQNAGVTGFTSIRHKISVLANLPRLACLRGQGFNRKAAAHFGNGNVTGLGDRIYHLLGMAAFTQSANSLYQLEFYEENDAVDDGIEEWRFRFRLPDGGIVLSSANKHPSLQEAQAVAARCIRFGQNTANYQLRSAAGWRYRYNILDPETNDIIGKRLDRFASVALRQQAIADMVAMFSSLPRVHVVEHILLRPKLKEKDVLLNPRKRRGIVYESERDPYSFRVSVVLPNFAPAFGQPDFQMLAEQVIRMETPAHIWVDVFWVNAADMADFEQRYSAWLLLDLLPMPTAEPALSQHLDDLSVARSSVVEKLNLFGETLDVGLDNQP